MASADDESHLFRFKNVMACVHRLEDTRPLRPIEVDVTPAPDSLKFYVKITIYKTVAEADPVNWMIQHPHEVPWWDPSEETFKAYKEWCQNPTTPDVFGIQFTSEQFVLTKKEACDEGVNPFEFAEG